MKKGGKPIRSCQEEQRNRTTSALLIVGPRRWVFRLEIEEARKAGAVPVTLGPRILRTETASIVGLSCILYANDELGGE